MTPETLRERFTRLPPLPTAERSLWQFYLAALRNHVELNPFTGTEFITWSTVQATMYCGESPFIPDEVRSLESTPRGQALLRAARSVQGAEWKSATNPALVHQAYHVNQWDAQGLPKAENLRSIVEFGGGYGAMALLIFTLGYTGQYFIFDFPELLLLQEYYLSQFLTPEQMRRIHFVSDDMRKLPPTCDLLIGIASLSEAPIQLREKLQARVKPTGLLIFFAEIWDDMDNAAFFSSWGDGVWETYATTPAPYSPPCFYLTARR